MRDKLMGFQNTNNLPSQYNLLVLSLVENFKMHDKLQFGSIVVQLRS